MPNQTIRHVHVQGPSHVQDMKAIARTGFSTNDDIEAALYSQQEPSIPVPDEPVSVWTEINLDDLEYPEPSGYSGALALVKDCGHSTLSQAQRQTSFFARLIRYIKRQGQAIRTKVTQMFSNNVTQSLTTPIAAMIIEPNIHNFGSTVQPKTSNSDFITRTQFDAPSDNYNYISAGVLTTAFPEPTIDQMLDSVLSASLPRAHLTREEIAIALVDSLRFENLMSPWESANIALAPPAPCHMPVEHREGPDKISSAPSIPVHMRAYYSETSTAIVDGNVASVGCLEL